MIDKILSIVLILVVLLVGGLLLFNGVFSGTSSEQQLKRQSYEQLYSQTLFRAVLDTNEQSTGATYDSLLSAAVNRLNTTIRIGDKELDVRAAFSSTFDSLLGTGNYYLRVQPALRGVAVSYVLDGSPSLAEQRRVIRDSLTNTFADLHQLLGGNASIYITIYVLGKTGCDEFQNVPDITCSQLRYDELYSALIRHSLSPAVVAGFASYSRWAASQHFADPSFLADSDWASGVAYASFRFKEDPDLAFQRATTNLHVIVPLADELSSSSKADTCFTKANATDWQFCALCDNTCPVSRSETLARQANAVVRENGDYVIGVYTVDCTYDYNESINGFTTNEYICSFADSPKPTGCNPLINGFYGPGNINWCQQNACGGCKPPIPNIDYVPFYANCPGTGCYCFHKACKAALEQHMGILANGTGQVLALTNLDLLKTIIQNHVTSLVTSFNFEIGVKNETRQRYIASDHVTLANGQEIKVELWVYE
jgi:hypothetical protein